MWMRFSGGCLGRRRNAVWRGPPVLGSAAFSCGRIADPKTGGPRGYQGGRPQGSPLQHGRKRKRARRPKRGNDTLCRSTASVAGLSPPMPDSSVRAHPRPSKYYLRPFPKASGKAGVTAEILRCFENAPSPGPRRLMKTPSRATLSPKGERGWTLAIRLAISLAKVLYFHT